MSKRFHSKVDLWLIVVLVMALAVQSYALFAVLSDDAPPGAQYTMMGTTVLVFLLIGSILSRTYYEVDRKMLTIVCGPIFRKISLDEIKRVTETRNPLSSPALSLDRLRIEYGNNRRVMISPADKREFLAAIGQRLSR